MKSKTKVRIAFGVAMTALFAGLSGSIVGTFAWYSYSLRTQVEYTGTAVYRTEKIQLGIVTDLTVDGLTTTDGIAWAKASEELSAHSIQSYLSQLTDAHGEEAATTKLAPATSRAYSTGDELTLTKSPIYQINRTDLDTIAHYIKLPLAIRAITIGEDSEDYYRPYEPIYITDASVAASNLVSDQIHKAVRVGFDDLNATDDCFIFNPSASVAGYTEVGGVLNLDNGDQYYDLKDDNSKEEMIYGDVENLTYSPQGGSDSSIIDVDGSGEISSFNAKHKKATKVASYTAKKQEYLSLADIQPDEDQGILTGGRPVCYTDDTGLGKLDVTVWLEGWDHSVVDANLGQGFNLGLEFQINK